MQKGGMKYYISLASLAFSFLGFGCSSPAVKSDLLITLPKEIRESETTPSKPGIDLTNLFPQKPDLPQTKPNFKYNSNVLAVPLPPPREDALSIKPPEKTLEEEVQLQKDERPPQPLHPDYSPIIPELRITENQDLNRTITGIIYSSDERGSLFKKLHRIKIAYDKERPSFGRQEENDVKISLSLRDAADIAEIISRSNPTGFAGMLSSEIVAGRDNIYKLRNKIKKPAERAVKSIRDGILEALVSSDILNKSGADFIKSFEINPRFIPGESTFGVSLDRIVNKNSRYHSLSLSYYNGNTEFNNFRSGVFFLEYSISF